MSKRFLFLLILSLAFLSLRQWSTSSPERAEAAFLRSSSSSSLSSSVLSSASSKSSRSSSSKKKVVRKKTLKKSSSSRSSKSSSSSKKSSSSSLLPRKRPDPRAIQGVTPDEGSSKDPRVLPKLEKAGCGDGIIINDEICDDGNKNDDDGCSKSCTVEAGYSCGSTQPTFCWK